MTRPLGRTQADVTILGYGAMELRGLRRGPEIADEDAGRLPLFDLTSGYVRRGIDAFPHMSSRGPWTFEQAYLFLGAAPIEGRIGGLVDIPNAAASVSIPLSIFDRNILPSDTFGGRELVAD